ncbi:MAG: hypothetical protein Q4D79_06305 [Propionibacteriaceae bacterium]|nr:hypothetical protein [Propionibacteriaceae bacterium]
MSGRHVEKNPHERAIAITILAVGSAVVLLSLFGSIWAVRAGAVIGIVMALAAVAVSWLELKRERAEHREEIKRQIAFRIEQAEKHHAESVAMIDRFNERAQNLKSMIAKLRRQLGAANSELSTMRGNAAWLRGEVSERQARIDSLEAKIAELEARLVEAEKARDAALEAAKQFEAEKAEAEAEASKEITVEAEAEVKDEAEAEAKEEVSNVLELPRVPSIEEAAELWTGDDPPTMVDLSQLNMAHYDEPLENEQKPASSRTRARKQA